MHRNFLYSVGGRSVCVKAFQKFWSITDYTRRKIEDSIRSGQTLNVPHGNVFVDRPDPKATLCHDWLATFCDVCEKQPDSEEVFISEILFLTCEIHTIARTTKAELYEDMCFDLLQTSLYHSFLSFTFHRKSDLEKESSLCRHFQTCLENRLSSLEDPKGMSAREM